MKAKFFDNLPKVLNRVVDKYLNSSDSSHLARTSRTTHALSKLSPLPLSQRQPLRTFLGHVVQGEHGQIQTMLRQDIRLLIQRDNVKDYSGRAFDCISGFEYALWALDKHLWTDMLACLPKDEKGQLTEEGQAIVLELLHQYENVKTKGVRYQLNEMNKIESHYDFAIIDALQKQANAQNALGANLATKNWDAADLQWRTGVGGAQWMAPMHVVDEYCSNTPFEPVPTFVARPTPARGLRQFYNWLSKAWEPWCDANSRLGFDLAIYKAGAAGWAPWGMERSGLAGTDLAAMTALCKTRTEDFILLEAQLKSLLIVGEQPRSVPGP